MRTNVNSARWLVRRPGAIRPLRLYCFGYAGGSASSYSGWQDHLDPAIELCAIELPGRAARFGEPPMRCLEALVDTLAEIIAGEDHQAFAFFGHSLGALVAFEVARRLQENGARAPVHVFVSGASAPQHRRATDKLHLLDDQALIGKLKDLNGTPPEVLASTELMELLLPTIRADFALAENYAYRTGSPLDIPLTVLMGRSDENAHGDYVTGWEKETSRRFRIAWFEGDHFYIQPQRDAVLALLQTSLLQARA